MASNQINRRTFITAAVKSTAAVSVLGNVAYGAPQRPADINASSLPRWRGFNLLEKFIESSGNEPFKESDFAMIRELGFDFVRLPMSYLCWSDAGNWRTLREDKLKEIDQAVAFGKQYGVHVSLNFHRGPGYSCAGPRRIVGAVTEPHAVRRLLAALGLAAEPPPAEAAPLGAVR